MQIRYRHLPEHSLYVAYVSGVVTEVEVERWVHHGAGQEFLGHDRIFIFEPEARLQELRLTNLRHIQGTVLVEESVRSWHPRFRSIQVVEDISHRGVVELYRALWDRLASPDIEFLVVGSKQEALQVLALPLDLEI